MARLVTVEMIPKPAGIRDSWLPLNHYTVEFQDEIAIAYPDLDRNDFLWRKNSKGGWIKKPKG